MSTPGDLAGRNRVSIRPAEPVDNPGVRALLTQMPRWGDATHGAFRDENILAIDDQGQIVGWLTGNHVSEAWRNIPGYDMAEEWRCSYITWVLVDEGCRSAGVGAMLMEAFAHDSATAGRVPAAESAVSHVWNKASSWSQTSLESQGGNRTTHAHSA